MTLSFRFPTPGFPTDLATGDARIDAHLVALDAALVGAAAVRRQTVMEARDFLLEARDHARDAGRDEATAVDEAIAGLGPIEAIAREQRAGRLAIFHRMMLGMGLGYATLMLLLSLLRTGLAAAEWLPLAGAFAAHAGFFGVPMGYLVAYVFKRAEPSAKDVPRPGSFLVHFAPTSITLSWGLAVLFGLSAALLVAGLAGVGLFATWAPAATIGLLLLNLRLIVGALRAARFRARVDAEALQIDGLFGQARIPRAAITGTARASIPMQLLIPAMGLSHWIEWQDTGGRARRTYVSIAQDMVHGDRLIAWLESAAHANTTRPGTASQRA
ncbi:hypothetical protein [Lysobacter brunescens]|uniref:Uncharacterized protein n=1 Tax=Lysobacter brunescens TaxID=262323 RepID=A0ABW2Y6L5_9GAMM